MKAITCPRSQQPNSSARTQRGALKPPADRKYRHAYRLVTNKGVNRWVVFDLSRLEIDNTTSYFSASSDHVTVDGFALLPVLVVGDITSQRVREDFLLPTFTARLGLPHKFQMDFRVPYGYELIRSVDANNDETSSSSFGLGDISASVSRQITTEDGRMPDMLANVLFKSTTGKDAFNLTSSEVALGTGFKALQGNLTLAKSSDPVVFFGNLSLNRVTQ
jgi:hypothetical protein